MDSLNQTLELSLEELIKDYEALAIRNKTLAEMLHKPPLRHQIRRMMLRVFANTYIPPSRRAPHTDRILLIRPDHLGDVLLTTPAIRVLRRAYPHTEIHALVGPWSAPVLENYDELDLVLTVPFPGFTRGKETDWRSPYRYAIQTSRNLRRIGYAQAVIFRPDHWWGAWVARLTGIPRRIGYNHVDTGIFLTDPVEHHHDHSVTQSLRLIEALIGEPINPDTVKLTFPANTLDHAFVRGYLSEWGITADHPYFCIHPGSGTKVKQWEPEKWAEVADVLTEQLQAQVIFTGGDYELPLIQSIIQQMQSPATIMAGDTEVGQLASLYAGAVVVLGPDSGPLHLAVAVDTPSVTLFGPADPIEFGPWGDPRKHHVLTTDIACRPCRILSWSKDDPRFHPCIRDITVRQVLNAARLAATFNTDSAT